MPTSTLREARNQTSAALPRRPTGLFWMKRPDDVPSWR
jgi:hypothetical protein